jgi:hypothetical protein
MSDSCDISSNIGAENYANCRVGKNIIWMGNLIALMIVLLILMIFLGKSGSILILPVTLAMSVVSMSISVYTLYNVFIAPGSYTDEYQIAHK